MQSFRSKMRCSSRCSTHIHPFAVFDCDGEILNPFASVQSSRDTLIEVRQMVVDRDAEMIARTQQLHDDIGKARAELTIAQQ